MKRFHILKTATKKSDITSLTWLERCDRASTILIQFGDEITQKKVLEIILNQHCFACSLRNKMNILLSDDGLSVFVYGCVWECACVCKRERERERERERKVIKQIIVEMYNMKWPL